MAGSWVLWGRAGRAGPALMQVRVSRRGGDGMEGERAESF